MGTKGHHHHHDHDHDHASHSGHQHSLAIADDSPASAAAVKRIKLAFYLNMAFALIELIGGILIGSFAIIADAIHDFGDSMSLALALVLQKKSRQGATAQLSYGYQRYSILSSLVSGTIIIAGSFVICVEAITHLFEARELPNINGMIGLAILGILVNGLAAFGLSHGHSHNEKILSWHLIEDLLGWIAVLIGALCIRVFQVAWIDPVLAIGISIFVLVNVLRHLKEPLRIIMQHVPSEKDLAALRHDLEHIIGVKALRDVHAWSLDGRQHVFTACLRISSWEHATQIKEQAREKIRQKGYHFINLEVETESCDHDHDHDHHHR
ncbi:MAG TPA: cation diffusion facilitator family transporter [Oligoflexus sp.]|uniref:cation diffusion facilitator family transporter n=1 Tax=Oligoflexus sp. TaxID=1971216 RepID=UPI002D7EA43E|nr:cation diffusion facilitator family transporter [Oligoflexus sp.]HET9238063.1 cation diffusion facilitator family transporter [Oligoflexus sp.]